MDITELKQKSASELQKLADELRAELRDLRFKVATRQWSKVRTVRAKRADLARVETKLRELASTKTV